MRPLQASTPGIRPRCRPSNLLLSVVFSCAHPCAFPLCSVRVVPLQALLTNIDDIFGRPIRFLLKYFAYHDGVRIKAVDLGHVLSWSLTRSSWHRGPIDGKGRECGIDNMSPHCSFRSKNPASSQAARENGGDLTSPWSQMRSLSGAFIGVSICQS